MVCINRTLDVLFLKLRNKIHIYNLKENLCIKTKIFTLICNKIYIFLFVFVFVIYIELNFETNFKCTNCLFKCYKKKNLNALILWHT